MINRRLFRTCVIVALLTWIGLLGQFGQVYWQRHQYNEQVAANQTAVAAPTTTPLPLPTLVPPTLIALPNTVAVGQGEAQTVANPLMSVHPKTGRYVAAWLPTSFDAEAARATFEANKDVLDEVSPFWYGVLSDGNIVADIGARDEELVRVAHANNVLVIPTVHNIDDPQRASDVLDSPELRAYHIQVLVDEVKTYNYDGIDIDYESLTPDMEDEFTSFITDLGAALHAEGRLLTIAVHAHTGRPDYENYAAIGAVVDRFRIMTYDYSWRGSPPGPIAPLFWVEEIAEYALTQVDPAKIQIGISFYAYDWPANWQSGGQAIARTYTEVEAIKAAYLPNINLQVENQFGPVEESYFNYEGRTVWFSNYRSLQAKMDMIRDKNLAGIAIWRLGSEDPRNWQLIRESLRQDPLIIQRSINEYLPKH